LFDGVILADEKSFSKNHIIILLRVRARIISSFLKKTRHALWL